MDPRTAFLRDALSGDAAAAEHLLMAWLPEVLGWCMRLGGPKVDASDAAQDVGIVLWTRLHEIRDPDCFPAWIFQVTRRVLAAHRRRAWIRRWVGPVPNRYAASAAAPDRGDLSHRVQATLERIPTRQREALVLVYAEGRTVAETAHLLGISPNTVKSRLRLGRLAFREAAEATGLDPDWEIPAQEAAP
ncbi:MAG: sigma-70 family RNA polymerase sigma factor [Deltaproteobacteria bacterium]|nr:sigma-70 family RNA polymerase sigma factor [Deltaproteobacteria bacterium]